MKRFVRTMPATSTPVLFRDYIHDALYNPKKGYFSHKNPPLLQHPTRIDFDRIRSKAAYQDAVASTFSKTPGWMTPVELFSPHLSRAVANRIQSTAPDKGPLNIIEIGAGRGTLARDILLHWEDNPGLMERVNYITVEISKTLAEIQKESLHHWILKGKASVCNMNALEWFTLERLDLDGHCHVIATEVLDNMGHDLVRQRETLEQAEIYTSEDGFRSVQWSECTDNTILSTLSAYGVLEHA